MATYIWPSDEGWPYPDEEPGEADPEANLDEDLLALRCMSEHALDGLEPVERLVVSSRFGVGRPVVSMKQLHAGTGLTRSELREALGSGLTKLRTRLS